RRAGDTIPDIEPLREAHRPARVEIALGPQAVPERLVHLPDRLFSGRPLRDTQRLDPARGLELEVLEADGAVVVRIVDIEISLEASVPSLRVHLRISLRGDDARGAAV